jgi:cysteine desulfurase
MDKKLYRYFDYAATTPLDQEVFAAMEPWLRTQFANPSSPYTLGHESRRAVDRARATIAELLHCSPQEIVFTSGGTESDNMALFGTASAFAQAHGKMGGILVSAIEHSAVLEPAQQLKKFGFAVDILPVEKNGIIDTAHIYKAVTNETILVSLMLANNEIGTIQPVAEAACIAKEKNPNVLFHSDACQATGAVPLDVQQLGVDLLTVNAGKIYGPKGVGLLYIKRGTKVQPLIFGGDQEHGLRAGTENVAAIVGFAKAMEIAEQRREADAKTLTAFRNELIAGLTAAIPNSRLNGDAEQRLPNNVNLTIAGIDGESLLMYLDQEGIEASLGSACTAGSLDPSHVLLAIGHSKDDARRSLRLTLGRDTTREDVDALLVALPPIVKKLRSLH